MLHRKTVQPQAAQKSLLLLEKHYPDTGSNHRSVAVEITGSIDITLLRKAMAAVIARHEMLRATVQMNSDGPVFNITPVSDLTSHSDWPLRYLDSTQIAHSSSEVISVPTVSPRVENLRDTLTSLRAEDFIDGKFDLAHGPLWRSVLIKVGPDKYHFAMMFNHVMIDEGSIGVIFRDLSACYNAYLDNVTPALDPIPSLLELDFSLPLSEQSSRLLYWKQRLADLSSLNLQTDYSPRQSFRFTGKRMHFTLNTDTVKRLSLPPEFQGFSHNQILLGVLYSLLYRYSGESDICIGITSSNRRHQCVDAPTAEKLVNCFFNSMPLRLSSTKEASFIELLAQVKSSISSGLKNQLPLDMVFQHAVSAESKSALRTAMPFNVMLVLNQPKPTLTLRHTFATPPVELDLGRCKFPYFAINLDMIDTGEGALYQCCIEYNTDLFNDKTIERLIGHFQKAIEYFTQNPNGKISAAPLLLEEEVQLLDKLNATVTPPVTNLLVPDFFHQQALACPDKTFIVFHPKEGEAVKLSYQEVDKQTTQLANFLKSRGVGPGVPVGISLTRSPNLLIAMLAVLKAGGTIVTLETETCPALLHKIGNTKTSIILADNQTAPLFENICLPINLESGPTRDQISQESDQYHSPTEYGGVAPALTPGDPAYIMYTSGTSGEKPEPKGVVLSHAGFANLMNALFEQDIQHGSKVICTALPTFDAFLYDVLCAMISRGELHLTFESGRYSPRVLESIIRKHQINFGVFLPNLLSLLNPDLPLTDVTSMGASPHEDILTTWCNANIHRKVRNGLGHTETGICLSLHTYRPGTDHTIIGRPVRNMQIFILNPNDFSLCPLGVPGEIYVAGPGVAIGYLDNAALTQEKFPVMVYDSVKRVFTPSQDTSSPGAVRLYATGDYGCYQLQPGNGHIDTVVVKFMGRQDRQLKINGVRVELDLVESVLRSLPFIKDVVVLPNQGLTGLTAYLVPTNSEESAEHVIRKVRKFLPTTLLPSAAYPKSLTVLKEFPVTQNGKVDIRTLAAATTSSIVVEEQPITDLQAELRKIWSEILQKPISEINIHQSFKELGGDSFSMSSLEVVLTKKYNPDSQDLDINFLTYHMTIAKLAEKIESMLKPKADPILLQPGAMIVGQTTLLFKRRTGKTGSPPHSPGTSNVGDTASETYKPEQLKLSQ
ncbi:Linear gramicidin synthase subunit D [Aquicella siphonis]|uniref:Linear gramicidin synthase subunit D n=1 Tax=Aquicella siphonis TaxID=254247 RepID=A0A5E4PJ31_9COXI|nr:AMP-binding protein [Aquicella siphonis]VVC76361.1 Linear gramicidin synthase subunit D [Aquicella siphonis]